MPNLDPDDLSLKSHSTSSLDEFEDFDEFETSYQINLNWNSSSSKTETQRTIHVVNILANYKKNHPMLN